MNFDLDRSDSTEGEQLPEDAEKVSFDSDESDLETSDDAFEYGEYGAQLAESAEEDGPEGSNEQMSVDDASKEQGNDEAKPEKEDAIEDSSEKKANTIADGSDEGAPQDLQKSPPTPDSAHSSTGDLPKAEVKGRERVAYSREEMIQASKAGRDSDTAAGGIEWSISERTYPRLPKTEEGQRLGLGSRDGSIQLAEMSEARSDSVEDGAERPESPKPDVVEGKEQSKVYSRDEMLRLRLDHTISAMKKVVDDYSEGPIQDTNTESLKALHHQRLNQEVERVANWLKEVDLS